MVEFDLDKVQEEFMNLMQSSTASTLWESRGDKGFDVPGLEFSGAGLLFSDTMHTTLTNLSANWSSSLNGNSPDPRGDINPNFPIKLLFPDFLLLEFCL